MKSDDFGPKRVSILALFPARRKSIPPEVKYITANRPVVADSVNVYVKALLFFWRPGSQLTFDVTVLASFTCIDQPTVNYRAGAAIGRMATRFATLISGVESCCTEIAVKYSQVKNR
jgi:hypothetical protein